MWQVTHSADPELTVRCFRSGVFHGVPPPTACFAFPPSCLAPSRGDPSVSESLLPVASSGPLKSMVCGVAIVRRWKECTFEPPPSASQKGNLQSGRVPSAALTS